METNKKEWWESRTIWTGVLTSGCAILKSLGWLPEGFDNSILDEIVTVGLGIATIIFRVKAVKEINVAPVPPAA